MEDKQTLLVWHPAIHGFYGEQLHFFLIKFKAAFDPPREEKLIGSLRNCDILGYCIYQLFGAFDILVRVWLNMEKRAKFVEAIKMKADFKEFIAFDINYLWANKQIEPDDIRRATIEQGTEKLKEAQNTKASNLIQPLIEQGLILKAVDVSGPPQGIKFFTFLTFQGEVIREEIIEALKRQVPDLSKGLRDITIYTVNGPAQFVIKAVADNFFHISNFMLKGLQPQFRLERISTETSLVASDKYNEFECDDVDFRDWWSPQETATVSQALNIKKEDLDILSKLERQLLYRKVMEAQDKQIFEKDKTDMLRNIFKGVLQIGAKRRNTIEKEFLYGLTNVEENLRKFFFLQMPNLYGSTWQKDILSQIIFNTGIKNDLSKYTLSDLVCALGWVNKNKNGVISNLLGDEWEDVFREAIEWRNPIVHGTSAHQASEWNEIVNFLMKLIPVHSKLPSKEIETGGGK